MGGLDWQAEAGGRSGGKEGRAGGWGPRASAGGKLGLLPTSKPVPTCLTSTSPGLGRPHSSRPPHRACASLQGCLASTWQEEWLRTRAPVTSNPKPDLGRVQTPVLAPKAAGRPAMLTPQPPPAHGAGNHSTPGRPSFLHPLIHSADSHCYAVWPWTSLLSSLACDVCHMAGGAWSSQLVSQGSMGGVGGEGGRKHRVGAAIAPTAQPMAAATLALPWSPRRVLESSSRPRTAEKGCPPPPIPFLFSGPLTIPPHIEGHKGGLLPCEVGSPFSPCDK